MTRRTLSSFVQVLRKTGIHALEIGRAREEKSGMCNVCVWGIVKALLLLLDEEAAAEIEGWVFFIPEGPSGSGAEVISG